MKLYNTNNHTNVRCHRISLLSPCIPSKKTLYYSKKLNPLSTNKSFLSSNQKKSRYHFLKSNKNKYQIHLKQEQHKKSNKSQKQHKQEEDYLIKKLRQEAYADLHATLQSYNDEFIRRMRSLEETSKLFSVPSTDSLVSSSSTVTSSEVEEDEMSLSLQNLIDLFEAGSIKDYSQLIEWETFQNPPTYFECRGEYGDLW